MQRFFLLACVLSCTLNPVCTQDLLSLSGAIETNFVITVANEPVSIDRQIIVERAWGSGISKVLELVTREADLVALRRMDEDRIVTFYDQADRLLWRNQLSIRSVDSNHWRPVGEYNFYSLNLRNVPLLLLDLTKRIDIGLK